MYLDPDDRVPDDDELCEPQGPVGEEEEPPFVPEPEDLLYEGDDD